MDEDEDVQSHQSDSHSPPLPPPQPQPPSGQITVTVAAAPPSTAAPPPPLTSSQTALAVALPIQQLSSRIPTAIPTAIATSGGGGGGGGGGREDCWSEGATSVLIDAWGERYMELSRGNLKQKHWKEVADIVSSREDYGKPPKTDIQCKNRIDTVKKKYKIEKAKVSAGNGPSRWPFFERLDRLIGPAAATQTPPSSVKGLGFATVSSSNGGPSSSGKAVPVGIPVGVGVGVRPLPLPFSPQYLQAPPHLPQPPQSQQPLQQQQLRHNFNFASPPISMPQSRFGNANSNIGINNNSNGNGNSNNSGGVSNVNHIGGLRQAQLQAQQQQFRRHPPLVDSDSDQEEWSNESGDSFPPERRREMDNGKRMRMMEDGFGGVESDVKGKNKNKNKKGKGKNKKGGGNAAAVRNWGKSVRDLTMAILKFGEAYEAAESKKLQHIKEMELQRMKFAKELELQRMKFMMKTQLELSQLNGNGNGNGNGSNNSDSRGGAGGGESNHHQHRSHHNHIHENHINHDNSDSSN